MTTDQQIFNITAPFATDPFLLQKPGGAELAEINNLEENNLIIDSYLVYGQVGTALLNALGQTPSSSVASGAEGLLEKAAFQVREKNNQQIDELLASAAAELRP